jgi:MFS transporter, UMF1 family
MSAPVTPATRTQVWAWGLWDWGSAAFNAVILTFVFSVYLTGVVGADLEGSVSPNSWLAWGIGGAGLLVALTAPVVGQRADGAGTRRRSVAVWTALTVLVMMGMFAVRADPAYFFLGLALLAAGSIFFEFAQVSYFAMLRQVSTPATVGRVSGFGWALGYVGGIVLLALAYFGMVAGDGPVGGQFAVPTADGFNIRLVAVVAAVWFALFALPLLFMVPEAPPARPRRDRVGVVASYRRLIADLRDLYRNSPHTVYFLLASAVFRDGLATVFTFGGVIAATVYGLSPGDVLVFAIAANVLAAIGAFLGGRFDDRFGPKPVIVGSLLGLLVAGTVLMGLSGAAAFWTLGLALTFFVGPAQSSSRSYLARLTPPGQEGQMFGLYATTGRAVSFLGPTLVGGFTFAFGTDRAGIAGILVVLGIGLLTLLGVRAPSDADPARV